MVSMGSIIVKPNAKKIRRIRPKSGGNNAPTEGGGNKKIIGSAEQNKEQGDDDDDGGTIVGFAGTTADAFTLLERLESKLDEHPGQLARSCVELAKGWRTDKYLRRLEASLLVADARASFEITGNGDVLESHDGVLGVGSGSPYAMAAARALMEEPNLSAEDVAKRAMRIGEWNATPDIPLCFCLPFVVFLLARTTSFFFHLPPSLVCRERVCENRISHHTCFFSLLLLK